MRREKEIKRIPTGENAAIVVKVYYSEGGADYFSGTSSPRGYWVSVTPETYRDGFITRVAFTGVRQFLEGAKRFSASRLASVEVFPDVVEKLVAHVMDKQKAKEGAAQ